MQKEQMKKECIKCSLNITDQEISEALAIDLDVLKRNKNKGDHAAFFGTICSGWWSNNWCE
ncbi:MAG: hypothetical protein PWQ67_2130 [Clostridia bacterium]|jgi:hypothetical protein|nr:hypothetical protein [Clostridia bacterium]MDN5323676.1 hypothetical protein [Clostridia bacterium]